MFETHIYIRDNHFVCLKCLVGISWQKTNQVMCNRHGFGFSWTFAYRQGTVLRAHGLRLRVWWERWRRILMSTRVSASTPWRATCSYWRSVSTSPPQFLSACHIGCVWSVADLMAGLDFSGFRCSTFLSSTQTQLILFFWCSCCFTLVHFFFLPFLFIPLSSYSSVCDHFVSHLLFLIFQVPLFLLGLNTTAHTTVSPRGSQWLYLTPSLGAKWYVIF